jgi:hypothetical protein
VSVLSLPRHAVSARRRLDRGMPSNASNASERFFFTSALLVMIFGDYLLQLYRCVCQLAQLNEPFPAIMGEVTHPEGGTAHEAQEHITSATPVRSLVRRLLT